jgi:hypothetical protein
MMGSAFLAAVLWATCVALCFALGPWWAGVIVVVFPVLLYVAARLDDPGAPDSGQP